MLKFKDFISLSEEEMDELEQEDEALYDESIDRLIDERNEF